MSAAPLLFPTGTISEWSADAHVPQPPLVRSGLLSYYAPYVFAFVLCFLYAMNALAPEKWWIVLLVQLACVAVVYRVLLRPEDRKRVITPALVVCILGQLHFMVINGAGYRLLNAVVISLALAAHLRGMVREYFLPHQSLSSYRLFTALFLASLSVYTVVAVAGAAVALLQFPLFGALGIVTLVTLIMTDQVMSLTAHVRSLQRNISAICTLVVTEITLILFFLPTLPLVAGALALSLYTPLLEQLRTSLLLPSRRAFLWGGSAIALVWLLVLGTARWP
jgi:hypothetical protein